MTDPDSYTTPPVVQAILDGLDFAEVRRIASLPDKQAELAVRIHRGKEMTPTPMVLPSASGPKVTVLDDVHTVPLKRAREKYLPPSTPLRQVAPVVLQDDAGVSGATGVPAPLGDPPPRRRPSKPGWYPPIVPPALQREDVLAAAQAEANRLYRSAGVELMERIVLGVAAAVMMATFSLATGFVLQ